MEAMMKLLFAFYETIPEWAALSAEFPRTETVFARDMDAVSESIGDADAMFLIDPNYTDAMDRLVRKAARKLRWIQANTVGVDELTRHGVPGGIVVTRAAGIFDNNVAEHAMALLLGIFRQIAAAAADKPSRQYNRYARWKNVMSVEKKNIGIIGYGGIGKQISRRAKAFGTQILVSDLAPAVMDGNADRFFPIDQMPEFLGLCDAVILTLPLTEENMHMFDTETFELMKKGSVLINVARGKLVRESSLARALREGRIAGAGLDVFEDEPLPETSELWDIENVVMTPHLAGHGEYNRKNLAELFRKNIARFLAGEELLHVALV
jgi:phosphoglycerate dehydrogenase-like enzyme